MKMKNNNYVTLSVLLILGICSTLAYLFINTRGNVNFALYIRIPKVIAFFWVAVCISFATIPFQTMTENLLLTPSIIGIDSLYIFFQTVTVFFFSHQFILKLNLMINFIIFTILVITASVALFYLCFDMYPVFILLMLLFCLVIVFF